MSTFPHSLDQMTPEWLTAELRAGGFIDSAQVESVDVGAVGGAAAFVSELHRLRVRYDRDEPGAPAAMVAKFGSSKDTVADVCRNLGIYRREVGFYGSLARDMASVVPAAYAARVDGTGRRCLLLFEALNPTRTLDQLAGLSVADAERIVDVLAAMHARWWNSPRLHEFDWLGSLRASYPKIDVAINDLWPAFLERWAAELPEAGVRTADVFRKHIPALLQWWEREADFTLCHYDFRAENIIVGARGTADDLVFLDWQLVSRHAGVFDLALLLGTSLATETRRREEDRLLRSYHTGLLERGVREYPLERAYRDYRAAVLTRLMLGIPGSMLDTEGNERVTAVNHSITVRLFRQLVDWDAGAAIPAAALP